MTSYLSPTMNAHETGQSPSPPPESDDDERSDPSVNTAELPDDHPIHRLKEAHTFYSNSNGQPDFLIHRRKQVVKLVVIPTKNGLRPKDGKATTTQIVAKVCPFEGTFASPFIESGMASQSRRLHFGSY